jgi:hypothetical protein
MRPDVHRDCFSHLLLIEGLSPSILDRHADAMRDVLEGAGSTQIWAATYALDFELRSPLIG